MNEEYKEAGDVLPAFFVNNDFEIEFEFRQSQLTKRNPATI
jgi:hypothetical protein